MPDNSRADAFEILGLNGDEDDSVIGTRYHELSMQAHPDRPGGDTARQTELNDAYAVLESENPKRALARIQSAQEISVFISSERAARQAEQTVSKSKSRKTRPLKITQHSVNMSGLLATASALLGSVLERWELSKSVTVFACLAFLFGAVTAILQLFIMLISNRMDRFDEAFSDPDACAAALAKALGFQKPATIVEADLNVNGTSGSHFSWLQFIPVDWSDVAHLLTLRSIEHGYLKPLFAPAAAPGRGAKYAVVFDPAVYRPMPEPAAASAAAQPRPQKVHPPSAKKKTAPRRTVVICLILASFFGMSTLGAVLKNDPGGWALGLLTLGCLIWMAKAEWDYRANVNAAETDSL